MEIRQRYLPAAALMPGMVLAKPLVVSEHGRVLLRMPAGSVLTEPGLEQMLAHHAEYACIEQVDERPESECQAKAAQEEARLRQIFRFANLEAPHTRDFFNALLNYRKS